MSSNNREALWVNFISGADDSMFLELPSWIRRMAMRFHNSGSSREFLCRETL
jgi:hypothetical protein